MVRVRAYRKLGGPEPDTSAVQSDQTSNYLFHLNGSVVWACDYFYKV